MDELDQILLDQLHAAMRSKRAINKVKKLCPDDPLVIIGNELIDNRIHFFKSMISDKSLLQKKHKKKKQKDPDILIRNPVYEWYKTAFWATTFGYKMFTDSVTQYMSYFKKGKK